MSIFTRIEHSESGDTPSRVVASLGYDLDMGADDEPIQAMLIEDIAPVVVNPVEVEATPPSGALGVEIGLSTEESGTPMRIIGEGSLLVGSEGSLANTSAQGYEWMDDFDQVVGGIVLAPYLVMNLLPSNIGSSVRVETSIKYRSVAVSPQQALRLYNHVDEAEDRDRIQEILP